LREENLKVNKRQKKCFFAGFLLLILISASIFSIYISTISNFENNSFNQINPSADLTYKRQWVKNSGFYNDQFWYISGSGSTDLEGSIVSGVANYNIKGERYSEEVILNASTQESWTAFNKTNLVILPDNGYGIDDDGCWVSHLWNEGSSGEQPKNTPRMHWRYDVNLGYDMSSYEITSAQLSGIINGSVSTNVDTPGDSVGQFEIYDWAQFYVEISDLGVNELNTYRIAFNQTLYLGNENQNFYDMEREIQVKTEQSIIDALNNVLSIDPGHNNFTVIIGIYIYCEDNWSGSDSDDWNELRFKSLNLTFSFHRKIDEGEDISWNQDAGKISNNISEDNYISFRIDKALLNFSYKSVPLWPENSPNSEFRIILNGQIHRVKIELKNVGDSWETANLDVAYLINDDINISIQLYIADTFSLNNTVQVSIDNVTLDITYTVFTEDPKPTDWTPIIYALSGVIGTLIIGFVSYQTYFKYPPLVRKVRKLRKKIAKGKTPRSLKKIKERKIITKNLQEKQIMDITPKENENPTLIK